MTTLVVAALSARMMAECAARDGFDVVALDLFGDQDTRRVSSRWLPIGTKGRLRIEPARLLDALAQLASRGEVLGWLPGAGFEAEPELLEQGAALLPLLGTAPIDVRRVRDPVQFFGVLDRHDIAHPPVCNVAPVDALDAERWLLKDSRGTGGWHVRRSAPGSAAPNHHYHQREVAGMPMSASFIANGRDVGVLGCNEMIVRRAGPHPYVFCGIVGPVSLPVQTCRDIERAVRLISAEFGLRGLCGMDFMCDTGRMQVLEVNPRPGSSMALYAQGCLPHGLMSAHVRACVHRELVPPPPDALTVRGMQIVFARGALRLDENAARHLARWPDAHDLPHAGECFVAGDPLCSLAAEGDDAMMVRTQLARGCEALLDSLEGLS